MTSTYHDSSHPQIAANRKADIDIAAKVAFLSQPSVYPDHPSRVDVIQTHMSWVFLTDQLVYKLKKPVRFDFLDFSTLERRHHDCMEELRLNRRLAPDVYLDVVPLTIDASGQLHLGNEGEPVEWLVKIKRLPRELMLDQAIANNQVDQSDVRDFTKRLAEFYQQAEPVAMTAQAYQQRLAQSIHAYSQGLLKPDYEIPHRRVDTVRKSLLNYLSEKSDLFNTRIAEHRIVEAHGDLRPEHVCLTRPPVFIDCLEFNRDLRNLDPADELAFLALECEYAGAGWIGQVVFETYRQQTDDDPPQSLIYFYKALRARLSIQHLDDHDTNERQKWTRRALDYLQLAEHHAEMLGK